MRFFSFCLMVIFLGGCASVSIPRYIQDKNPYQQVYYAEFDDVRNATLNALNNSGWSIEKEADPSVYEVSLNSDGKEAQQTVLFTKIRQLSFFVGSRYARLNVFLRVTSDKATEAEIRYLNVSNVQVKTFNDYKNDRLVQRLFQDIEENLK